MWLFQPPSFPLARSALARMHQGTHSSVFNCMTWLSVAIGASPGLGAHSTLFFRTGCFYRSIQSCKTWTSLNSGPTQRWQGWMAKHPTAPWPTPSHGGKGRLKTEWGQTMSWKSARQESTERLPWAGRHLAVLPFPHQLPLQHWNTGAETVGKKPV